MGRERERKLRNRNEPAERHSFNRVRGYKWVLISLELEYCSSSEVECI